MISKKLVLPLSIAILFYFSATCIAGSLHFGVISAIEEKIGELEQKRGEEQITYIEATTGPDGKAVVHDDKHDLDVTISIEDEATGEGIEGVKFQYIHIGNYIICVTRDDPNHAYFSGISILPASQVTMPLSTGTLRPAAGPALITIIIKLVSLAVSAHSAIQFVKDPPHIDIIMHHPLLYEQATTGDVEQLLEYIGGLGLLNIGGPWFAIAHAVAPVAFKEGLQWLGVDIHKKYKLTRYWFPLVAFPIFGKLEPIEGPNNPPNTPSNPSPADGTTNQSIDVDLGWEGGDPDAGDTVTYDVYFEPNDSSPDVLVSDDQSGTTYDPGTLSYDTHYYWKIVAVDNHGAYTSGPVWRFTTSSTEERVSVDVDTKYWEDGSYQLRITAHAAPLGVSSITISGPHIDTATVQTGGGDPHHLYDDGSHHDGEANDGVWWVLLNIVETPAQGETIIFDIAYNDGSSETKQKGIDGVLSQTAHLFSPPDGSTVNALTPTFEWSNPSVSGLTYSVQVNDTNGRVYHVYNLPDGTTSHTVPSGYLEWGTTYYWLVSGSDANGNEALTNYDIFTTPGS